MLQAEDTEVHIIAFPAVPEFLAEEVALEAVEVLVALEAEALVVVVQEEVGNASFVKT